MFLGNAGIISGLIFKEHCLSFTDLSLVRSEREKDTGGSHSQTKLYTLFYVDAGIQRHSTHCGSGLVLA